MAHFSYYIQTTTLHNLYNQTIYKHIYQAFRVFVLYSLLVYEVHEAAKNENLIYNGLGETDDEILLV